MCGRLLVAKSTGRPQRFCSARCRQRAYRARLAGNALAEPLAVDDPAGGDRAAHPEKAVPHLSERQLLAWRGLLEIHARLLPVLDDELRGQAKLSVNEFDVLYQLWTCPGSRQRMKQLASMLLITPSGVTRIVSRLEDAGLVRRVSRPGEQAVEAELTAEGQRRLDEAMDAHFAGVKRHFVDALADAEIDVLTSVWDRLRTR